MTTPPKCHYDKTAGWITPEHVRDCAGNDCRGCKPCGKSHCGIRSCANHVEQHAGIFTCPGCIGRTRKQLRQIENRYALEVPIEAEYAGVNSEAANLIGPAADPGQWAERRRRIIADYDGRGWCDYPRHDGIAADDPHHPYAVLGRWDMAVRESYGHHTDLLISVSRAVDYLGGDVLDRFAHTQEFEDFSRDVADCLSHLEDVLSDSRKPEQGAPCPTCRGELEGTKAPRLTKRYGHAVDASEDSWHCPRNEAHTWGDLDYRARVDGDYLEHATALTADQMHAQHEIRPGSLRAWASLGLVHKRGKNADGLTVYDVAEALKVKADGRMMA